jgi:hypothetical protein
MGVTYQPCLQCGSMLNYSGPEITEEFTIADDMWAWCPDCGHLTILSESGVRRLTPAEFDQVRSDEDWRDVLAGVNAIREREERRCWG